MDSENQEVMAFWNVNNYGNGSICDMCCQDIIVIPELGIMFVRFEVVLVEYSLEDFRESDWEMYRVIHYMHDSELFVGNNAREKYE